jgi:GDP-L-fucose synthase
MRATVFGSTGLLGTALVARCPSLDVLAAERAFDGDISEMTKFGITWRPNQFKDVWVNAAAKVGGVQANMREAADFYRINVKIGTNVVDLAHRHGVKKLVSVLSTCIYPDGPHVRYPLTEEQLHMGPPHHSNFGYAYAKRMVDVASRAYRQQHGCDFITAVPNNLYGPSDNYDLNSGHVIPALIRKFFEAHRDSTEVWIWGSGNPVREFTYSEDAADAIWWLAENYSGEDPINIGCTDEISIGDLARMIGRLIGFKGRIRFDTTKPDGQFKKPTSNARLRELGYKPHYTRLEVGLAKTIDDFISKYPRLRGIT